jgi:hypothetical protein
MATGPEFVVRHVFELEPTVRPDEAIVSALPDWRGRVWFVTTKGLVGTLDRGTGSVRAKRLAGEAIGNSFAVDESGGVYVVSDHAMYRFDATKSGAPRITWRRRYDRGHRLKPGQVNFGSGTTPTLFGRRTGNRFVAITDNADPRMHVLVYRRGRGVRHRLVCRRPVFPLYRGATENSIVAVGRRMVVENNYGYTGPTATEDGKTTAAGLTRVDLRANGRGCRTVWTNRREHVPSTVSKASVANGLFYTYSKNPNRKDVDAWYLAAVSFRTGRTIYRRLAGTDLGFNNNFGAVYLGPDGRTAYVGVLGGLVELRDRRR